MNPYPRGPLDWMTGHLQAALGVNAVVCIAAPGESRLSNACVVYAWSVLGILLTVIFVDAVLYVRAKRRGQ